MFDFRRSCFEGGRIQQRFEFWTSRTTILESSERFDMSRRMICTAVSILAFLAICFPVHADTAPKTAPAGKSKPEMNKVTTGYTVYYCKPNADEWTEYETFVTYEEASEKAKKWKARGYWTQLQAKTAMKKVPSQPKAKKLPDSATVTMQQIRPLFATMASQRDIAFRYPTDGCYARAHLMVQRMQAAGYKPCKVWSQQNGVPLYVRTQNHPKGFVTWRYHVAPALKVRYTDGKQVWYVIDPSLFTEPVTITKWRDIQKKPGSTYSPYITWSKPGEPPTDINKRKLPGSGYWLGADPKDGADAHARKTMRKYKPYEGRMPPRSFAAADERVEPLLPIRPVELLLAAAESNPLVP